MGVSLDEIGFQRKHSALGHDEANSLADARFHTARIQQSVDAVVNAEAGSCKPRSLRWTIWRKAFLENRIYNRQPADGGG